LIASLLIFFHTGAAIAQEPDYRIRADVKLVRLLATVKDPAGDLVGDLSKSDFKISDNGVPQEVAVFERTTAQPLSVSVLVDTSSSTATNLKYETDSVTRFLRALFREGNVEDRASLYSFSWEVALELGFTRNLSRLEGALKKLKSTGGTAMYDALQFAGKHLQDRDGRRVIIIVTDGGDTVSSVKFADALEAAQRSNAVIYPILVVPITNGAGRNTGGEHALQTLAAETGGRVFTPNIGAGLDAAFDSILRDLRSQYLLAYYPKNVPETKNRFHRLKIEIPNRSGLRISTRSGYYGDAAP
jgi:Ca-activated chloride channel family protein